MSGCWIAVLPPLIGGLKIKFTQPRNKVSTYWVIQNVRGLGKKMGVHHSQHLVAFRVFILFSSVYYVFWCRLHVKYPVLHPRY